jgi:CCR4-NOT transcription complex subunit 6
VRPAANAMYYTQQSPGIAHKLAQHPAGLHDPSPWSRTTHHPALGPPGHAQQPTSPGYPLFTHANGMNALQHHPHAHIPGPMGHHHHQNSLSHSHAHYQSPPNGNGIPGAHAGLVQNGSPANAVTQIMTPHWQNQLMKCEVCVGIIEDSCKNSPCHSHLYSDDSRVKVSAP